MNTSANASAASSCDGSSAIEGCIRSKGISRFCFKATANSAAEAGGRASPGAPRQRDS